jgi:cell division transport system permease protein
MKMTIKASAADARLLPEGRFAGPMPWVIAIMMFLTILAAAAGLSLGSAARGLGDDLAGRLTVQIMEGNVDRRTAQIGTVRDELSRLSIVDTAKLVPAQEIAKLLDPWLGQEGIDPDLPIPALIDVTLKRGDPAAVEQVRKSVQAVVPTARIDEHAQWLAPLARLLDSLKWLSAALVLLMAAATTASVVLAARAALNNHQATIEVMHLLGASDSQIAILFQRRIALDALFGGLIGLGAALLAMAMVGNRLSAIGSDLLGSVQLGWFSWAVILLLPLFGAILSTFSARFTVVKALRRLL